ncbi:PREDICTED: dynein heavy chain 2, axonemal [Dinoponera quadriceps]|uniref:Dynein heavy chain 2, axonemal n=1 Tax=Dinoponera quadriceps TaxID=609295 RepID=A0A6P3X9Q2_DINQU|nr:PREDICTED: dynein heavy chain 2, axonemal [Dinoponera quadriceps]
MPNKKEQKMEKTKKADKPPVDPHREFLDMDTDEEDFGRQESPETEEELPSEPIKPIYSEQDLNKLVEYVKNLTVLPSIKDSDWSQNCDTVIREYFENPAHALLSVYFDTSECALRVQLSVPEESHGGFVYFLRTPWHVFTVENFHATVVFGSINRHAMMCVLKAMENMYVPVALNSSEWPEIIRNNLFRNLHNFLMCLTERVYKPMGLTKLYIPREKLPEVATSSVDEKAGSPEESRQRVSEELSESKKAIIERLEGIVRCWIRQIREVLASTSTNENRQTVFDELQYWTAIYFDLCCLHDQLSHEETQTILRLLENVRSPSVDSFHHLTVQLHEGLEQAASNVTYLKVLSDACNDLKCPDEVEEPVTKVMLLILFIWTESSFYNTSNNIEVLCRAVSAQVVQQCKEYVDLQALLEGAAENGTSVLRKCISCCRTYRTVYDKVTSITGTIKSNGDWSVNDLTVFNRIDTFTRRCYDLIEICDALIVFGRRNKVGMIGSARGTQYEAYCRRIEDLFYENLDEIKLVRDDILDVTKCTWLDNMQKFRGSVMELENMVKTLIDRIFEEVQNVEEGVEAIYALQRFKHRESLRDVLSMKWVQVWKIFGKEIESCSNSMTLREVYHPLFQHHAKDANLLCIARYLERLFHMMIDASDWIGDCAAQKYILERYKQVTSAIDNKKPHDTF